METMAVMLLAVGVAAVLLLCGWMIGHNDDPVYVTCPIGTVQIVRTTSPTVVSCIMEEEAG